MQTTAEVSTLAEKEEKKDPIDLGESDAFNTREKGLKPLKRALSFSHEDKIEDNLEVGPSKRRKVCELQATEGIARETRVTSATSTPIDRVQSVTNGVPELPHKPAQREIFMDRIYLEVNGSIGDAFDPEQGSSSPCKNIKQVVRREGSSKSQENEVLKEAARSSVHFGLQDIPEDLKVGLPVDFFKISKMSFEDWTIRGLEICRDYEVAVNNLVQARLKFSEQVRSLKIKLDEYASEMQEKRKM